MIKQPTLTIGITALNEEKNIGHLLKELASQSYEGLKLEKILVVSDGSKDKTVEMAERIKNKSIQVMDEPIRMGKNARTNQIISLTNSDILVFFDADILIKDKYFIKKLTAPIIYEDIDLTSSGLQELRPKKFFEKVLFVSMELKQILFNQLKNGNNVYNCHGPAKAMKKSLYKKLVFLNSDAEDMYSYLYCIKNKMKFKFVSNAYVSYRLPSTPIDHYKQSSRYLNSIDECKRLLGDKFVSSEFDIPVSDGFLAAIKSIPYVVTHIVYVFAYLITYLLVLISKTLKLNLKDNWNVSSSKALN